MACKRTHIALAMFRLIDKRVIIAALATIVVLSTGEIPGSGGGPGAPLAGAENEKNISRFLFMFLIYRPP